VIHVSVLLTVLAESLVTFVLSVRHEASTRYATPLSFAHGTLLFCALLVVVVVCASSKMPVAFGAGDSNVDERARWAGHPIAMRLVTDVRDFTCTRFVARVANYFLTITPP